MTSGAMPVSATRRGIVAVAWLATVAGATLLSAAGRMGDTDLVAAPFTLVFLGLAFDVVAFGTVGAVLAIRRPGKAVGIVLIVAVAPATAGLWLRQRTHGSPSPGTACTRSTGSSAGRSAGRW